MSVAPSLSSRDSLDGGRFLGPPGKHDGSAWTPLLTRSRKQRSSVRHGDRPGLPCSPPVVRAVAECSRWGVHRVRQVFADDRDERGGTAARRTRAEFGGLDDQADLPTIGDEPVRPAEFGTDSALLPARSSATDDHRQFSASCIHWIAVYYTYVDDRSSCSHNGFSSNCARPLLRAG